MVMTGADHHHATIGNFNIFDFFIIFIDTGEAIIGKLVTTKTTNHRDSIWFDIFRRLDSTFDLK